MSDAVAAAVLDALLESLALPEFIPGLEVNEAVARDDGTVVLAFSHVSRPGKTFIYERNVRGLPLTDPLALAGEFELELQELVLGGGLPRRSGPEPKSI